MDLLIVEFLKEIPNNQFLMEYVVKEPFSYIKNWNHPMDSHNHVLRWVVSGSRDSKASIFVSKEVHKQIIR